MEAWGMSWLAGLQVWTQVESKAQLLFCLCPWALVPAEPEHNPVEGFPLFLAQPSAYVRLVEELVAQGLAQIDLSVLVVFLTTGMRGANLQIL